MKSVAIERSRILKSPLQGLSTWALPLALTAIATPVIIRSLGESEYGLYLLIMSFAVNLNPARAITKEIVVAMTEKDYDAVTGSILVGLVGNIAISLLCSLVIWTFSESILDTFLKIESPRRGQVLTGIFLIMWILPLINLNQLVNAILQGLYRFDAFSRLYNLGALLIVGGNVVLAYSGYKVIDLLRWYLASNALLFAAGVITCFRSMPSVSARFKLSRTKLNSILGFAAATIGFQIVNSGFLLFERGWIMRYFGPTEVAYYVVPLTLGIFFHHFVASMLMFSFPLSSALASDPDRLERLYLNATRASLFIVFFAISTILVQANGFLSLWIGPVFAEKAAILLVIHIFSFGFLAIQITSWQLMEGLGRMHYNFMIFLVATIIGVGLILMVFGDDSIGVALSRLTALCLLFVNILVVEHSVLGGLKIRFWGRSVFACTVAAILGGTATFFCASVLPRGWTGLLVSTSSGFVVYTLTSFALGVITRQDISLLNQIIGASISKARG